MKPRFYRKVLDNGMVVMFEKRNLPIVAISFAARQGGIHESKDEKGISHFIEHMLYKGTKKRSVKQIGEEIERNGGKLNAFTSETVTACWCKMPSKHLQIGLDVLSDVVQNPLFEDKELEKERKVIFEEIKMYHDNPVTHVVEEIQKSLYEKPFGIPLIGTYETMKDIDRKKIIKKFNEAYKPNNMVLCVVGNAEFDDLVKFVEKNFGKERGRVEVVNIKKKNEVRSEKRKGLDQANLIFAYHIPLAGDKKSYAAYVLNAIMTSGMSSRLFSEIREKRNLAYAVGGDSDINKDFAYTLIHVGTTKENVEKVKELILKEFEKVAKGLKEEELKEVKDQIIGNYHISMEDSVMQMTNLLLHEINNDAEGFYDFEKNIRAVKLEDVKNLANIKDYSFFSLVPD